MKVTVGTIMGAIVAVAVSMATESILEMALSLGLVGILLVAIYYLEEFRAALVGGMIPLTVWTAMLIIAPEMQITILAYLPVLVAAVDSFKSGLFSQIVEWIGDALQSIVSR